MGRKRFASRAVMWRALVLRSVISKEVTYSHFPQHEQSELTLSGSTAFRNGKTGRASSLRSTRSRRRYLVVGPDVISAE